MTLVEPLVGGALVGLSAVLLMLALGRIAGISGIVGGLCAPVSGDRGWRIAFLLGLIAGPFVTILCGAPRPAIEIEASPALVLVAGLLVGFGTRLGSGCTSGHGVCGLSRFSSRSLAATLTFMAVGATVVFVIRHGMEG